MNKQRTASRSRPADRDRIDTLFSVPGARADRWRALHSAAVDWARGHSGREPVDAGVAIAIRDINLVRRRDGDIGRTMEGAGSLFDRIAIIP